MREKLIELVDKARRYAANKCHSFMSCAECRHYGEHDGNCRNAYIAESLIANGVTFATDTNVGDKRIEELEAKLAEREEAVCNLRKKWQAAETHICTMCGHFGHKTDGNIVYGNKSCGELVGYPCCGKFTPWIPVTERLPEYEEPVMGWDAEMRDMGIVNFVYGQFFDILDMSETNVTHWMPLPEPPKGE